MLHELWGKAKDHADYVKAEWVELQARYDAMLRACEAVVRALDYRDASPDPKAPNYVNPAVVAADRSIAERLAREAVAKVKGG